MYYIHTPSGFPIIVRHDGYKNSDAQLDWLYNTMIETTDFMIRQIMSCTPQQNSDMRRRRNVFMGILFRIVCWILLLAVYPDKCIILEY